VVWIDLIMHSTCLLPNCPSKAHNVHSYNVPAGYQSVP